MNTPFNIDGQVLVSTQIIDDAAALLAVNHVGIEAPGMRSLKISNPGDGLSAERIEIRVVPDHEGNGLAMFRKHDAPPTPDVKKWQRKQFPAPNLLHHTFADAGTLIFAAESEPLLYAWVQKLEFVSKRPFVNGPHRFAFSGCLRQRDALGILRPATIAITESAATARFNVSGLKAAVRYSGAAIATAGIPASIKAAVSHRGQV